MLLYLGKYFADWAEIFQRFAEERSAEGVKMAAKYIAAFTSHTCSTERLRVFFDKRGDSTYYNFVNFCWIFLKIVPKYVQFLIKSENV